jgi:hypothetical protein
MVVYSEKDKRSVCWSIHGSKGDSPINPTLDIRELGNQNMKGEHGRLLYKKFCTFVQ